MYFKMLSKLYLQQYRLHLHLSLYSIAGIFAFISDSRNKQLKTMILNLPDLRKLPLACPGLEKAMICYRLTMGINSFEPPWPPGASADLAKS